MNTNNDVVTSGGPQIEGEILLKYLIKRCHDLLESDHPSLSPVLQGLGFAVLAKDEAVAAAYKDILSSSRSPQEIIRNCIEIFQTGLDRHLGDESHEPSEGKDQGDHQPDAKTCRRVMMQAIREANVMSEQSDYFFSRVFAFLTWIGLQCDAERLVEFEAVQASCRNDPEKLVREGRQILKDSLFRRRDKRQSSVILPQSNS